jgi:hypothetical protein
MAAPRSGNATAGAKYVHLLSSLAAVDIGAAASVRRLSALNTGDVDHHGTAQPGGLRIAHFTLQWTRKARRSLSETSFALKLSFSALTWIPSVKHVTLIFTAVTQVPASTSVAQVALHRTGFEKQRLSAFSRRGPSFWPLDRY